jgi:hypothetical protein
MIKSSALQTVHWQHRMAHSRLGSLVLCCCAELHACRTWEGDFAAKGYRRRRLPVTVKPRPSTLMALSNPNCRGFSSSRCKQMVATHLEGCCTSQLTVHCDFHIRTPSGLLARPAFRIVLRESRLVSSFSTFHKKSLVMFLITLRSFPRMTKLTPPMSTPLAPD